jgi:mono/diheme cytochrome c family protein
MTLRLCVSAVMGAVACVAFGVQTRAEPISVQVGRGGASYAMLCAGCHGAMLDGGRGPPLRGAAFLQQWKEKTARNLYSRILTTMPVSAPGSLPSSTVLDLTLYLLKQNDLNVGSEAKTSADMLNAMTITH